jgi:DNA polymerase-3 subunit gamma/tau
MLSAAAFNAFLKTLEEPPPYAIFILATTEKHKILPTILSRCQIFDFKRITTHDIVDHLHGIATKEGVVAQEAGLHVIAQKSEGCMRDALSMLDRIVSFTNGMLTYASTMEHLNMLDADFYFRLTDHILSQDVSGTLLMLDNALERGFEGDVILEGMAEHMRNLLLCKDPRMARLLDVPNDHKPVYHEKANQAPPSFILSALNVINDSELNYKNANNKRLHIEMCLIRLCYVLQAASAEPGVKKNTSSVAPPPVAAPLPQAEIPKPAPVQEVYTPPPPAQVAEVQPQVTPVVAEPRLVPEEQSKPVPPPQPPTPAPVATVASSPILPPNGNARRVSKNLLASIDEALNNSQEVQAVESKELTLDIVQALYDQFKDNVKAENKSMLHAQLSGMTVEVYPPDEVRIITPSSLADEYARDQRNIMIDYFRKHTGILVRVTTEIREDKSVIENENKTVMSKQEVFEAMVKKNPDLGRLKDNLNLQIEY